MTNQCYYCKQIFASKEELYKHLITHTNLGLSSLSEDEIIEQFNQTKTGEPSRMSSN